MIMAGLFSLLLGVLTLTWRQGSLVSIIWVFIIPPVNQGFFYMFLAVQYRKQEYYWWMFLLPGVTNIVGDIYAIYYLDATALYIIMLIGLSWFGAGIVQVIASVPKSIRNSDLIMLSMLVLVAVGLYHLADPGYGYLALMWMLVLYALVIGLLMIFFGLRIRIWSRYFNDSRFKDLVHR